MDMSGIGFLFSFYAEIRKKLEPDLKDGSVIFETEKSYVL